MAQHIEATQPKSERDLDPNVRQRQASDPNRSVWVNASAGTGKTKVLTDRVLRLILPRPDGTPGTPPYKILCLTFTKAAASEMALRINKTLSEWAILPVEDEDPSGDSLNKELQKLLGRAPSSAEIIAAKRLFADVIDVPGGLKIMTIHSFCQSLLSRFPLEAGLPPYFTVLEDAQARELQKQSIFSVIQKAKAENASPLHEAFTRLAGNLHRSHFYDLMNALLQERLQLRRLTGQFGTDALYTTLCKELGILPGLDEERLIAEACSDEILDRTGLQKAAESLILSAGKTDKEKGENIRVFLDTDQQTRIALYETYKAVFLTEKCEIRKKIVSNSGGGKEPATKDTLEREAERLFLVEEQRKALKTAELTRALLTFGQAVITTYDQIKLSKASVDFDDLIARTADLLQHESSQKAGKTAWVLFKLDQGIDHILIDEAQDTNPEQWQIIKSLCTEFFENDDRQTGRTLFTVGDEKQSIYSFQRASPDEFSRMQTYFSERITQAGKQWQAVSLNISFRSTKSVLEVVDTTFSEPGPRKGLSKELIEHFSYRSGQAGQVELWPLCETVKEERDSYWQAPLEIREHQNGASLCAKQIAQEIKLWLVQSEELPSKCRPVRPGDIMILVRTRNAFVTMLEKALKAEDIPVSGLDRMVLNEQLIIEDLLLAAEFGLFPDDDLTLAAFLKSPLIGMDEAALYELAYDRPYSLWKVVREKSSQEVCTYLRTVIATAQAASPYEFFNDLLLKPCPADEVSGLRALRKRLGSDILDPLEEFLSNIIHFEKSHIASLQLFLKWHKEHNSEIKRETADETNAVRIMTVHGAKGLQAPIVFLPDTIRSAKSGNSKPDYKLLWPDRTGMPVPVWSPKKELAPQRYLEALQICDTRMEDEYLRLLYVAMTRAEDRLIVTGYKTLKTPLRESWYYYIEAGLRRHPEVQENDNARIFLKNPQVKPPDQRKLKDSSFFDVQPLPPWAFIPAEEETAVNALSPSHIGEEPAAFSPLNTEPYSRFRRGLLTHKLLEILPDLPKERRPEAASDFMRRFGNDIPEEIQKDIVTETVKVLNHPDFSEIFSPLAKAEVPLSGFTAEGIPVHAQIDRLLVKDEGIWVIDFKTNRPPPHNPECVPGIYRKQMALYSELLKKLYPGRPVHAALLWTDGPFLMPIAVE